MKRLHGLYAITDQQLIPDPHFEQAIEAALLGGARIIQYRDKSTDAIKRQKQARALSILCERYNAISIINDDIELAATVGADGVHLGKHDVSLITARERLGDDAVIGVSCYGEISLALEAEEKTANYVAFGAMFPSTTKPDAPVAGPVLISAAKSRLNVPVCAIGGISEGNIGQVIQQGADMAAVINGIFSSSDIKRSATEFSRYFEG